MLFHKVKKMLSGDKQLMSLVICLDSLVGVWIDLFYLINLLLAISKRMCAIFMLNSTEKCLTFKLAEEIFPSLFA